MTSNPKSSPWYSTPKAKRRRKGLEVTLSDEARARLEALADAEGVSLSAMVEALILSAPEK